MKSNVQIWSPKQNKIYYKVLSIYHKLDSLNQSEPLNGFEFQFLQDIGRVQGLLDILHSESLNFDLKGFKEDTELLKALLNNMADFMGGSNTGTLTNKKFTFTALDYFLTLKPLLK